MSNRERFRRTVSGSWAIAVLLGVLWSLFVFASLSQFLVAQTLKPVNKHGNLIGNVIIYNLVNINGHLGLNVKFQPVNGDLNIINTAHLNWWQGYYRPDDPGYPRIDPQNINGPLPGQQGDDDDPSYYTNNERSGNGVPGGFNPNTIFNGNNWWMRDFPDPGNGLNFETWLVEQINNTVERLVGFNWGINANGGTVIGPDEPSFINNTQYNWPQLLNNSGFGTYWRDITTQVCGAYFAPDFFGPPYWGYSLVREDPSIPVYEVIVTDFCPGTIGELEGAAVETWTVENTGGGLDEEMIIFTNLWPDNPAPVISTFLLYNPSGYTAPVSTTIDGCPGMVDGPLPVELVSFDAIAGDGRVTLAWTTASETFTDRFEITRDNVTIAAIPAANSAAGSSYEWIDEDVINGTTYGYTLAAVDIDGTREILAYAEATPAFTIGTVTEYSLHQNYPNPFNPSTIIAYDLREEGMTNLTVYNLLGQEIAVLVNQDMTAGRHTVEFSAGNLSAGVYIFRLTVNGFTSQKKMILMK